MRILFISHSSPLNEGGAETRTREVAFRLARSGHKVTILCGKTAITDLEVNEVNCVTIITKKTLPDVLLRRFPYPHYFSLAAANLFLMFHIPSFLRNEKFDLIREDMAPFPPSFLLSLVRLPVSRRVVVVHMLSESLTGWIKFYGAFFGFVGFMMDRLLRRDLLQYDRIICASKWFADELKGYPRVAGKVRYVPNGVNLEEFNSELVGRISNGNIRLLCVGRLVETKGHRYVIEALSHLKAEYPRIKLDILGNGPLKEPLMNLARDLAVADLVQFRPPVSHQRMPELLNEYDYFVMPSLWEGLPVSLIEAMASKLPIVATNIPAFTAVLDSSCATMAAKEDATDLAAKLKWAFEHPEEIRTRSNLAYEIASKYDWALTARGEIEELKDAKGEDAESYRETRI